MSVEMLKNGLHDFRTKHANLDTPKSPQTTIKEEMNDVMNLTT
jgi:hypothetical protein